MYHAFMTGTTMALSSDLVVYAARLMRTMRRSLDLPAGIRVLSILDETSPQGITQLAQADNCSQPTMSAQVAQLAQAGLVSKAPNPADARGSVITLTEAGRAELGKARGLMSDTVRAKLARSARTPEELAIAVAVLRDLVTPAADGARP
jgi:DNA-binding MarR family transcriptional regulator